MDNNTTIYTKFPKNISQEELTRILTEFDFEDTTRKCDVPTLLSYLVVDDI